METKLTFHELEAFNWCRLRWHYAYNMMIEPVEKKAELTLGACIHNCLENYYSKLSIERTLELLTSTLTKDSPNKAYDILGAFYKKYGQDTDVEGQTKAEIRYGVSERNYFFAAHPDLMCIVPSARTSAPILRLYEQKTGKDPDLSQYLLFDIQKWFYASVISAATGAEVVSFTYTTFSTSSPFNIERVTFPMSMDKAHERLAEFVYTADNIMSWREEGWKAQPHYNLTCSWSCQFYLVCLARLSGGDEKYVLENQYRVKESTEGNNKL